MALLRGLIRPAMAMRFRHSSPAMSNEATFDQLKAEWKKSVKDRKEFLNGLSEEERAKYVEGEGIPTVLMQHHLLARDMMNSIGVPASEHAEFLKKYEVSPGLETLEFIWDSPPPIHTYEELPIIKEA